MQKTAEFPPHSLPENVFLQTSDSDGKYSLNECPLRFQPTRCQQPQTCEPQIRFFGGFLKFISPILSEVEKSINLVVKYIYFLNPSKNGGDIIGKFRGRPRHIKNTAPTDLCCAPRAPLSEDWGYVTPPAPWRRRP